MARLRDHARRPSRPDTLFFGAIKACFVDRRLGRTIAKGRLSGRIVPVSGYGRASRRDSLLTHLANGFGQTVPRLENAGRGGFMRRYLTLVFLVILAVPTGITFSGCTRNPAGEYCNGLGYGLKDTDVQSIDLEPRTTGVSIAFGQTRQISAPTAKTCKGTNASVSGYSYGTTNNQLIDISPSGNMCAGTWNRNSGGGIADYTICNFPSPLPETSGLP